MEENKISDKNLGATKKGAWIWELVKFTILAVIIVVPIRMFIAQPFVVSGSSMVPTFENGQYLIVDEISYRFNNPERGDVIIFKYPNNKKQFFIKRIIGLPNETLKIDGQTITIINEQNPDGLILDESYIQNKSHNNLEITMMNNEYFVMGDNRTHSSDSRVWGTLPENLIIGRALLRLLPISKINLYPGEFNLENK